MERRRPVEDRRPAKPTIGGLVYPGKRHLFSGPPESARTIGAYALALEEIRSGNLGLLIDLEMGPHGARDVLRDLGATDDELSDGLLYVEPETAPNETTIQELISDYADRLTLAIIDAAAGAFALTDLDDYKRRDAELWANLWVRPLWHAEVASITIDHVVKNTDNRGKYAIGSERKVGQVDVHLGFETIGEPPTCGGHGLVKITTHRDRPGWLPRPRAAELELHSDPETHRISWAWNTPSGDTDSYATFRPTVLMARVLERTQKPTYEPASRSALANAVPGKRQYVLQAIDCLLADGILQLDGKQVVPVPGYVPGTFPADEGNGNVPRSLSTGKRVRGTTSPDPDDDIPF